MDLDMAWDMSEQGGGGGADEDRSCPSPLCREVPQGSLGLVLFALDPPNMICARKSSCMHSLETAWILSRTSCRLAESSFLRLPSKMQVSTVVRDMAAESGPLHPLPERSGTDAELQRLSAWGGRSSPGHPFTAWGCSAMSATPRCARCARACITVASRAPSLPATSIVCAGRDAAARAASNAISSLTVSMPRTLWRLPSSELGSFSRTAEPCSYLHTASVMARGAGCCCDAGAAAACGRCGGCRGCCCLCRCRCRASGWGDSKPHEGLAGAAPAAAGATVRAATTSAERGGDSWRWPVEGPLLVAGGPAGTTARCSPSTTRTAPAGLASAPAVTAAVCREDRCGGGDTEWETTGGTAR
mmetsp:Transcript_36549/g.114981  ORF Transcript_36549/g.114981 Transcript_36549/m.114981 type:complete len:359 (-) Transcript_36549:137-1213(-)